MKVRTATHITAFGSPATSGIHTLSPSAVLFINKIIQTIKSVGYTYVGHKSILPSNDGSKRFFKDGGIEESAIRNAVNGSGFTLYEGSGGQGRSAMTAYYKIPTSKLYIALEVLTWMTTPSGYASEYLAISITNDTNDSKRTSRYLIPLKHNGFQDDTYLISASDFGGLTITLNRGSTKRAAMFMEPVYGLASSSPDGIALGSIGEPMFSSSDTADGPAPSIAQKTETPKLLIALGEAASWPNPSEISSSANAIGKLGYSGAASVMAWSGGGTYDAVLGVFDVLRKVTSGYTSPSKMFYTGTQGERVVIPNGPMLYTSLYSSQRLRMICLMSKSAIAVGESLTVVNPISDTQVEQFTYTFKTFTSDTAADFTTMVVGTLDGDVG